MISFQICLPITGDFYYYYYYYYYHYYYYYITVALWYLCVFLPFQMSVLFNHCTAFLFSFVQNDMQLFCTTLKHEKKSSAPAECIVAGC